MGVLTEKSLLLRCCKCLLSVKPRLLTRFDLLNRSLWDMAAKSASKTATPYEESVARLNCLQSNAETLKRIRSKRSLMLHLNVAETKWCLEKCGIEMEDVDKLNVIHISGTKGKGSTCAFTESILRQLGFKTGFFSSPHLVHVRERIRINGCPLSEDDFTKYFQYVYGCLDKAVKLSNGVAKMPAYFKFLTVLAFHVFIEEKVDVAIVEVGIGGEHDCTNAIQNPVVCGVTTLDYDHMALLGSTIESIAWQKGGIFKKGGQAVVSEQEDAAMEVLKQRAAEKNCVMHIAPPFSAYDWPKCGVKVGIAGVHQQLNVTLALQLAKLWLKKVGKFDNIFEQSENISSSDADVLPGFAVPQKFLDGIRLCRWPGRSQIIKRGAVTFYLDGAHTPKSLDCCIEWFLGEENKAKNLRKRNPFRILLFHCTGNRSPSTFLPELKKCAFNVALFCPARIRNVLDAQCDQSNYQYSEQEQLVNVANHAAVWKNLPTTAGVDPDAETFNCIQEAMERIAHFEITKQDEIVVLVTGSLHLVGGVLALIDCQV